MFFAQPMIIYDHRAVCSTSLVLASVFISDREVVSPKKSPSCISMSRLVMVSFSVSGVMSSMMRMATKSSSLMVSWCLVNLKCRQLHFFVSEITTWWFSRMRWAPAPIWRQCVRWLCSPWRFAGFRGKTLFVSLLINGIFEVSAHQHYGRWCRCWYLVGASVYLQGGCLALEDGIDHLLFQCLLFFHVVIKVKDAGGCSVASSCSWDE